MARGRRREGSTSKRRPRGPRFDPEPEEPDEDEPDEAEDPDAVELLGDVRDILLMILRLQTCPECLGSGRTPDGMERVEGDPFGKERVRWTVCGCRREAAALLEQWR